MTTTPWTRVAEADVDPAFLDRWSPRTFRPDPLSDEEVQVLFEAARWAPSCYNDQPWVFHFARAEEDRRRYAEALVEANRAWAGDAPLLIFVTARRRFLHNQSLSSIKDLCLCLPVSWLTLYPL